VTAPRPRIQLVREGNPGHRTADELEPGIVLPPGVPEEPHWPSLFPTSGAVRKRKTRAEKPEMAEARERHNQRVEQEAIDQRQAIALAHETWAWVTRVLDPAGILTEADQLILVDLCLTWVRIRQAEEDISRSGLRQLGERGWTRNGSITTAGQYRQHWKWLCAQLGLSPVARDRVKGAPVGDDDDSGFDV
jgi:P27 family predicted phage terminase small subunit